MSYVFNHLVSWLNKLNTRTILIRKINPIVKYKPIMLQIKSILLIFSLLFMIFLYFYLTIFIAYPFKIITLHKSTYNQV